MNNIYIDKVRLLLRIMPIVMEEECFEHLQKRVDSQRLN